MKPPKVKKSSVISAVLLSLLSIIICCTHTFSVKRVVDGDTLLLNTGKIVRLIGVDTPETKHPRKPVEYYGKEASAFTKKMVGGKEIRLEYDKKKKDRYGRLLAYVYLIDGTFLNAEIIKHGYGRAYTKYPFKYLDLFVGLEKEARGNKKGMWGK